MKRRPKVKIAIRWNNNVPFVTPLQRCAPTARRAPEFLPEVFYRWEEEALRTAAPVQ